MRLIPLSTFAVLMSSAAAMAQDYPLTIEHKFGTTVIEEKPERVATLDYVGADDLLALGVQPVAIRYWYGDYEHAVWPWAEPLLTAEPEILKGEINFEQVAASDPDVIFAMWSGITDEDYEKLSKIAPVVAVVPGIGDYEMPWDERALLAGEVVGEADLAQELVDGVRAQLDDVAAAHPDWAGKTASVAYMWGDAPGAYTSADIRPQVLAKMGFTTPEAIDANPDPSGFTTTLSTEDLSPLDGDLIIWISTDGDYSKINGLPTKPFLTAAQEGYEVFLDAETTGAFSHSTLLSLPYAVEKLVPQIEAVID
ncbi:ABC transporter substrate-binding protein [Marivivens donghaensis]|uniref:ABC transporter substrate-binding protein n=1 Tax=Marivivens donghaensis TaxID=1699413 RepID=A0ABX0W021_9RHOB|nr:ABC transporter substrate-binding protein [Marivivens donghaensis]NIY73670.1 ABC transporter substrate-binding protein [Marivivens donghaensis]